MNARIVLTLGALILSAPSLAAPDFVPSPKLAFEGFTAINPPRPEVPVGALWVDGYGATGPKAPDDNVETVRSLTGVNMEKELQLNLSAAILQLVGIDPRYRDRYTARFTDLSIVRVKDPEKLDGPAGELRILEALKAGSVIVSTDGDLGLNAQTLLWGPANSDGNLTSGRRKANSIEGRDMVVAIKVGRLEQSQGRERKVRGVKEGEIIQLELDGARLSLRRSECRLDPGGCLAVSAFVGRNADASDTAQWKRLPDEGSPLRLPLAVPVSDGKGGLYEAIELRRGPCAASDCLQPATISTRLIGSRLKLIKPSGSNF